VLILRVFLSELGYSLIISLSIAVRKFFLVCNSCNCNCNSFFKVDDMENSLFKLLIEPCVKFVMMLTMDITRYATPCFKKSVNYMK